MKTNAIRENSRFTKDIETKLDDFNEKINDLKSDYQTKESQFKTHKSKIKELEAAISLLKTEYEDARQSLEEIKVNAILRFCSPF